MAAKRFSILNPQFSIRNSPFSARAFTLIELIIVVVILAILATLVLSAANGMIQSWKTRNTAATMEVLGMAIGHFTEDGIAPDEPTYRARWGPFPPDAYLNLDDGISLVEQYDDVNNDGNWNWNEPVKPGYDFNKNRMYDPRKLRDDFPGAFETQWMDRGNWVVKPANYFELIDDDFNSIESLHLYLTRLCPRARAALERLAHSGQITNGDTRYGQPAPDALVIDRNANGEVDDGDERIDMPEVVDAWRRPLKYAVRPLITGAWQWELRSAGPDGRFAAMWTPEDQSDDVVLRGP